MMPELDGFGVLRALRLDGVAPELPVVVMTSYPEMCTREVEQLLELGTVVPVLAKAELLSDPDRFLELLNQRVLEPTCSA
jgi:CheY-like chemotaxis protein